MACNGLSDQAAKLAVKVMAQRGLIVRTGTCRAGRHQAILWQLPDVPRRLIP